MIDRVAAALETGRVGPSPGRPKGTVHKRQNHKYLAIASGLFLTIGITWGGFNSNIGKLMSAFGNILLLLALLIASPTDDRFWYRARTVLALVAFAAIWLTCIHLGIAIVPFAQPPVSLAPDMFGLELATIAGAVAILLSGMRIGSNPDDALLAASCFLIPTSMIFFVTFILRVLGFADQFTIWELSWQGRFAGPLGNANVTAAVAGFMVLIVLGQMLKQTAGRFAPDDYTRTPRSVRYIVLLAILAVSLVALTGTASRFAIVTTAALAILLIWRAARIGLPKVAIRNLAVAAVLTGILVWISGSGLGLVADRFSAIQGEGNARIFMWGHYLDLVLRSPVYGYGLGSFSSLNAQSLTNLALANALWRVNSPHNILLQIALGGGLPYLTLILAAAWLVCKEILHDLSAQNWPIDRLAIAAGLTVIIACSLVDIALDVPAVITLMLFGAGLLWRPAKA
jgi:O-antigen ligase